MQTDLRSESIRPTALVTGASAGIGLAFARELAGRGHDLVLTARREQRLLELADELSEKHQINCAVLSLDLAEADAPSTLESFLADREIQVDVLVNNAGYGVPGAYLSSSWDTHAASLQVMVSAVAELSWRLAGPMRERGRGRIINIASLAGMMPAMAGHTLYGGVKAWMIRFSEALAFELQPHGVSVTAVCPGFTHSEFHDVTGTREQASQMADYMWMSAGDVARQGLDAAERGDIVFINGRLNRFIALLPRYLPRRLMLWVLKRRARQFRNAD